MHNGRIDYTACHAYARWSEYSLIAHDEFVLVAVERSRR